MRGLVALVHYPRRPLVHPHWAGRKQDLSRTRTAVPGKAIKKGSRAMEQRKQRNDPHVRDEGRNNGPGAPADMKKDDIKFACCFCKVADERRRRNKAVTQRVRAIRSCVLTWRAARELRGGFVSSIVHKALCRWLPYASPERNIVAVTTTVAVSCVCGLTRRTAPSSVCNNERNPSSASSLTT